MWNWPNHPKFVTLVAQMSSARLSACILISHKGNNNTIHIYSVTVMTHVKALQAGQSSQPGGHLSPLRRC